MNDQDGNLQFAGRSRERPGVNIAPLIDIVFLLLVFFMLTTSFLERQAVMLSLPPLNTTTSDQKPVIFRVFADGRFGDADHVILSPTQLGLMAVKELEADPQRRFHIASDRQAPVQATLEAMDILRGAGAKNMRFSTPPERSENLSPTGTQP